MGLVTSAILRVQLSYLYPSLLKEFVLLLFLLIINVLDVLSMKSLRSIEHLKPYKFVQAWAQGSKPFVFAIEYFRRIKNLFPQFWHDLKFRKSYKINLAL